MGGAGRVEERSVPIALQSSEPDLVVGAGLVKVAADLAELVAESAGEVPVLPAELVHAPFDAVHGVAQAAAVVGPHLGADLSGGGLVAAQGRDGGDEGGEPAEPAEGGQRGEGVGEDGRHHAV